MQIIVESLEELEEQDKRFKDLKSLPLNKSGIIKLAELCIQYGYDRDFSFIQLILIKGIFTGAMFKKVNGQY